MSITIHLVGLEACGGQKKKKGNDKMRFLRSVNASLLLFLGIVPLVLAQSSSSLMDLAAQMPPCIVSHPTSTISQLTLFFS